MIKTYNCYDFLLNRWSVAIEYPKSNITKRKYYKILGGDDRLHDLDNCTALAGILKDKI